MGMVIGILGNMFKFKPRKAKVDICPHCEESKEHCEHKKDFSSRIKSIFRYAFIDMPKEIGLELLLGLLLAAAVAAFLPVGKVIKLYLAGMWAYPFSLVFGLIMYFCSTASVPLVHAFLQQGMNIGAALILLLVGPITSYGTILVLRKEFGARILTFYLVSICVLATILGVVYQNFP